VQGSGFRVQGSGFRVQGSGFRVQGSGFGGFRVQGVRGLGFRVQGSGFRVQSSGFRVQGLGFRVHQGLRLKRQGSGVKGSSRVKGQGIRVQEFMVNWEGPNHCRSHSRLAKFRGLMYGGKHSALLLVGKTIFVRAQYEISGYGFF
jgi:hypothetical protein